MSGFCGLREWWISSLHDMFSIGSLLNKMWRAAHKVVNPQSTRKKGKTGLATEVCVCVAAMRVGLKRNESWVKQRRRGWLVWFVWCSEPIEIPVCDNIPTQRSAERTQRCLQLLPHLQARPGRAPPSARSVRLSSLRTHPRPLPGSPVEPGCGRPRRSCARPAVVRVFHTEESDKKTHKGLREEASIQSLQVSGLSRVIWRAQVSAFCLPKATKVDSRLSVGLVRREAQSECPPEFSRVV